MDALTKTGKLLRQQRMMTFAHLRDVRRMQPRWEQGADITVLDGQRRIPFEGPWLDFGAGGSEGAAAQGTNAGKA